MPCTAIATRPGERRLLVQRRAARGPAPARSGPPSRGRSPTESAMQSSATTPAAREASHQPYSDRVRATPSRERSDGSSTPPAGVDGQPAALGERRLRRPGEQRDLGERLGLERGGGERGGGEQAGPARGAGRGVEQVVGAARRRRRARRGARRWRSRSPRRATRSRAAGCGRSGCATCTVVRAAERDVAAGVDHVRAARRRAARRRDRRRGPCPSRRGRAAGPGGRAIVPAASSTATRAPGAAARRGRAGRAAARDGNAARRSARASGA